MGIIGTLWSFDLKFWRIMMSILVIEKEGVYSEINMEMDEEDKN